MIGWFGVRIPVGNLSIDASLTPALLTVLLSITGDERTLPGTSLPTPPDFHLKLPTNNYRRPEEEILAEYRNSKERIARKGSWMNLLQIKHVRNHV